MALPLDGYVRVSRVGARDQSDGFISPDVQEKAIRDWAARGGVEIIMQHHELNVSGGTMDRPVFNRIMERIRDGRSGGLVVFKLDRFARTILGALTTLEELGRYGATFASATEPALDYTTPAGRAFVQQLFVFAEFTRSTLKESWAVAQRHAIERGIHISPNGFLGYDVGPDRRLVPNDQAPIVREVFERRADGAGWGTLAHWLEEVAPREDGTTWTPMAVQRLTAKRVYRGEASRYVVQDKDDRGPIINPHAHDAIVDEEIWQRAQMKPRVAQSGPNGSLPLLSGLVRCAGCRFSMSLGNGPRGERLYRCRRRHASGTCPRPAQIRCEHIEEHVEALVLAEIDGIARLVPDSTGRDRVVAELEQARSDLEDFRQDRAARRRLGGQWLEWLDTYLRAVSDLEGELRAIDERSGVGLEGLTRDRYLALDVDDRREVLGGFVDCIMVRPSRGRGRHVDPVERRTRILWRGQGPDDLPRRRVVNPIVSYAFEDDVEAGVVAAQDRA
ncbi:MAG: recombinase family protein [Solirubrobacteraceae bacterium]